MYEITDREIDADGEHLKLRIYEPENPVGCMLFLHGGGWINGSIYSHDGPCILLANLANIRVVSVNYRKAPENKFPAGLNDGLAALDWLVAQGFGKIMLGGESSGGNIAAVMARHARDKGIELAGQMLIYPVTDGRMNSQSYALFNEGYMISKADLAGCFDAYLPIDIERTDPNVSPLLAEDLADICPTFIATCDHDPLRDDGRAYAAKLREAGVDVQLVEMENALHGIWIMKAVTPLAEDLVTRAANWAAARIAN